MTVTARNLLRLPVLLLMLAAAGCAVLRPGPEITAPDGASVAAPEANPQ